MKIIAINIFQLPKQQTFRARHQLKEFDQRHTGRLAFECLGISSSLEVASESSW